MSLERENKVRVEVGVRWVRVSSTDLCGRCLCRLHQPLQAQQPPPSTSTITTTDSDQAVSGQLALWVEFVMPGFDKEEQWNKKKDNLAVCAASILILFFIKLSITSPNTVECYVSGVR